MLCSFSDVEKALYIHDYIILNCAYDYDYNSYDAYECMGAHLRDGGAEFVTYAPNAVNVELMLNGSMFDMHRDDRGVWSCFHKGARQGDIYQYVMTTKTLEKHYRSDPFAFYDEVRPKNASILFDMDSYSWGDDAWLRSRDKNYEKPLNIYEMHFGSWRIKEGKTETERFYRYEEMADILIPYIKEMGYTHIELLPLTPPAGRAAHRGAAQRADTATRTA